MTYQRIIKHPNQSDTVETYDTEHEMLGITEAELSEMKGEDVRQQRDIKLTQEVDPIVSNPLRWADMTTAEQNAWSQYRTDLLNITDKAGFPHSVTWPTKP